MISGLKYIPDYLTDHQHDWLINRINHQPWLNDLKRLVQHYGYKYDYRARKIDQSMHLGDLPDWLLRLSQKLHRDSIMPKVADQCIINRYLPGEGISKHIDCKPCFQNTISSLTVSSGAVMEFERNGVIKPLYLEPRSIVVLSGEARLRWTHCIPSREADTVNGIKIKRGTRISLTFRNVII